MLKKYVVAILALILSASFLVPLITIFSSWLTPDWEVWSHIQEVLLSKLIVNSLSLVILVVLFSGFLGITLAACVVFIDLPFSKLLTTLLVLPLAMPPYVLGFTLIGIMDYGSPGREYLGFFIGDAINSFEMRNLYGTAFSLSLSLFPYVFLLTRQAFISSGSQLMDAARSLGAGPVSCILRVIIPMGMPFILSGMSLVALETLADFGTVSMFSFSTFTTGIYKAWFGLFSVTAASQLASLLIFTIALFVILKSLTQNMKRLSIENKSGRTDVRPVFFGAIWKTVGGLWVLLVLTVSLFLPSGQLLSWSLESYSEYGFQYGEGTLEASLEAAVLCALAVLVLNLLITVAKRWLPKLKSLSVFSRIALLGYATPGAVLAVGMIRPLIWLDHRLAEIFPSFDESSTYLLSGSLLTLVLGLTFRFFSIGFTSTNNGMKRIPIQLDEAGRSLGASAKRIFLRIQLPLLAPSSAVAFVMVFVEAMKEMPLTLMTRPFGWDTLSVRIFELTSEGEWERAAQPSIILTLIGIIPVYFLLQGARNVDHT